MRTKGIQKARHIVGLRGPGVLAMAGLLTVAGIAGSGTAAAGGPSSAVAGIVPAAGSGTAWGYTAAIRHVKSDWDGQGKLVLVAPDGRFKTIGAVSDYASVFDVSSNARTIVTGFYANTGRELRLTIWDSASGKPTYLRVKNGNGTALTAAGIVVARDGLAAQLYSRSGQLQRTFTGASGRDVVASPNGTKVLLATTAGRVQVRDARTGKVTATIPLPRSQSSCLPGFARDTEITLTCTGSSSDASTVYRAGYSAATPTKVASPAADARTVADGMVYRYADGDTTLVAPPIWRRANGSTVRLAVKAATQDGYGIVGAYKDSVFLAPQNLEWAPSGKVVRQTLSTGKQTVLAGPGTRTGGLISSAKTVDGT